MLGLGILGILFWIMLSVRLLTGGGKFFKAPYDTKGRKRNLWK